MALTRDFKETILARIQRDPKFRNALLKEGIEALLAGDVDTGKSILRDCIKATVGFEQLGADPRRAGGAGRPAHTAPGRGGGDRGRVPRGGVTDQVVEDAGDVSGGAAEEGQLTAKCGNHRPDAKPGEHRPRRQAKSMVQRRRASWLLYITTVLVRFNLATSRQDL